MMIDSIKICYPNVGLTQASLSLLVEYFLNSVQSLSDF